MPTAERRRIALTAGWAYLAIIVCGLFAEFAVRQRLGLDSPKLDSIEFKSNLSLVRLSIASDLVMLLADVVVAWALWRFFRSVNPEASVLAAMFRMVQAAVIASGVVMMMQTPEVRFDWVRFAIDAHGDAYRVGLVFFGACCLVTAWLALRSGEVPKWIGVLISLAGVGYLVDAFGRLLLPAYASEWTNVVLLPAFVGEISFCLWLIGWGGRKSG